ncbi:unnamed protein product [Orchesella dallaii]|uniref:Uncharacterized protein n=1 Tax=Orchesella dallaii TaxID=48710 RepID=A0ABP1QQH0_9HEXA
MEEQNKKVNPMGETMTKVYSTFLEFVNGQVYCSTLGVHLEQEIAEYFLKCIEFLAVETPSGTMFEDKYVILQSAITTLFYVSKKLADNFIKNYWKASCEITAELKKVRKLSQIMKLTKRAKEDPLSVEVELQKIKKKADEAKSQFDRFKAEWEGIKEDFHRRIDACIQLRRTMLEVVTEQMQQAAEK